LVQKTEDLSCEAAAWSSLGYAHHHLGRYARAVDCYRRSVDVYLTLGDPYYQAVTLSHLGDALHAADDPASARDAWRQTLEILDQLDHHNADKIRDRIRRVVASS
jgi:tetratricopeptide (TPR) repeat protein